LRPPLLQEGAGSRQGLFGVQRQVVTRAAGSGARRLDPVTDH
jgi:hypothetical protein